jgi:hypothetical protein
VPTTIADLIGTGPGVLLAGGVDLFEVHHSGRESETRSGAGHHVDERHPDGQDGGGLALEQLARLVDRRF